MTPQQFVRVEDFKKEQFQNIALEIKKLNDERAEFLRKLEGIEKMIKEFEELKKEYA